MKTNQDLITLSNVSKIIQNKQILKNVNAEFECGKIYGIIGENGSGKTMLLRAIAGLIHISSGEICYAQKNILMGVIIENPGFLLNYSGLQNLKFLARIRNEISESQIRKVMCEIGLNPDDKRNVRQYSLGMKQKLAIVQALMEEPNVLLLDEPFRGLDTISLDRTIAALMKFKERGGMVVVTGHEQRDLILPCDFLYQIYDGKLSGNSVY